MRTAIGMAAALAAMLAAIAPAAGEPDMERLRGRFASGAYLEAASAAEAAAGADELAFAARALLAHCMTAEGEPDGALLARAAAGAAAALLLDPRHSEGRLQLAIALALQGRAMSVMDAWNAGNAQTGRRLAGEVLAIDPANHYAHGYLAVWNLEVRRRGGAVGAGLMGASVTEGRRHYRRAAELAPADIGVHWQYARALVALDARRYGDEAAVALSAALSAAPKDHVETVMASRAAILSAALQSDRRSAQRSALGML